MSAQSVTPSELHALIASGQPVQLIDVRTPVEFREVHAVGARSVPLDRLGPGYLSPRCARRSPALLHLPDGKSGSNGM